MYFIQRMKLALTAYSKYNNKKSSVSLYKQWTSNTHKNGTRNPAVNSQREKNAHTRGQCKDTLVMAGQADFFQYKSQTKKSDEKITIVQILHKKKRQQVQ